MMPASCERQVERTFGISLYIYIYICVCVCGGGCACAHTHTHTHKYVYIFKYIYNTYIQQLRFRADAKRKKIS